MSHLDEGTIHALLDGEIPAALLTPIQAHLAGCAECRARLAAERTLQDDADQLIGLIEVTPARPPVPAARGAAPRRSRARDLAWAASLVAAAGLGYAARDPGTGAPPAQPLAVQPVSDSSIPAESSLAAPASPGAASRSGYRGNPAGGNQPRPPASRPAAPSQDAAQERPLQRDAQRGKIAEPAAVPPASPTREEAAGRVDQLRVRNLAEAPAPASEARPVGQLDGTLRLIPGLIPSRLEMLSGTIRVIYRTDYGELVLAQERRDGRLVFTLTGPPGFPADSLERLRRSVRE